MGVHPNSMGLPATSWRLLGASISLDVLHANYTLHLKGSRRFLTFLGFPSKYIWRDISLLFIMFDFFFFNNRDTKTSSFQKPKKKKI
jgi:hypothetical protein